MSRDTIILFSLLSREDQKVEYLGDTAYWNIALVVKGWDGLCRIESVPEGAEKSSDQVDQQNWVAFGG